MKKGLVLVAVLFLISGLAWAEGTAPGAAAPEAVNPADSTAVEGGCILPDFTGLSPDQRVAAALAAGFQMDGAVNRQVPICPSTFLCTSLTNCVASPPCTTTDLGNQCCASGGGQICCASGTIKVRKCPCACSGSPCSALCATSTDVTLHCP